MLVLLHGVAGGWDELLIALVAFAVLWVAVKLAGRKAADDEDEDADAGAGEGKSKAEPEAVADAQAETPVAEAAASLGTPRDIPAERSAAARPPAGGRG